MMDYIGGIIGEVLLQVIVSRCINYVFYATEVLLRTLGKLSDLEKFKINLIDMFEIGGCSQNTSLEVKSVF
jgi:hypothetical protein